MIYVAGRRPASEDSRLVPSMDRTEADTTMFGSRAMKTDYATRVLALFGASSSTGERQHVLYA
jgi:hypothetical protein